MFFVDLASIPELRINYFHVNFYKGFDDLKTLILTIFDFYEIYRKRSPQWIYSEDFPLKYPRRTVDWLCWKLVL